MSGTYLLLSTLLTIFLSVLAVRAGAVFLTMTGMHYAQARFQALSAFSGTGFTTREAESVVNNPRRRAIISWLMLLGNAGIVVVIVTATTSFVNTDIRILPLNIVLLGGGIAVIYFVASRTGLGHWWESFVENRLAKSAVFDEAPLQDLLHVADGYGAISVTITDEMLAEGRIARPAAALEGNLILGRERAGKWEASPPAESLREGDRIVVYGKVRDLAKLRPPGSG